MKPGRLILLFAAILLVIFSSVSSVSAQGVTAVTTANARLRGEPNQSASILITVPYGMTVSVNGVNSAHSWFNVTYSGITGWMSASLLNVVGNVNSLPVMGSGGGVVQPALSGVVVTSSSNVRLRSGPGVGNSSLAVIPAGTQLQAVGINADRTWIQVNYGAQQGWVAASLMRVINGSLDSLQSGGGGAGGATGGGTAAISFSADRTSINSGECVTIRWDVDNINQVFYQGSGVTGHETRTECPGATTTYVLRVLLRDGSTVERTVTVTVGGGGGCSSLSFSLTPTFSRTLSSGFSEPYGLSFTGGGPVNGNSVGYRGYYACAASARVQYTSGSYSLLRFYFVRSSGANDATMLINGPHGGWFFNDDSWGTYNPTIDFNNPVTGQYDIWVGTLGAGQSVTGTLYITEVSGRHP